MLSIARVQDVLFGGRHPKKDPVPRYPSAYRLLLSVEENVSMLERELLLLRHELPNLEQASFDWKFIDRIYSGDIQLPLHAERWALLPRWDAVAKTLEEAIGQIHTALKKTGDNVFNNYRTGSLGSDKLQQSQKKMIGLQKLAQMQHDHAVLIAPIQSGLLYADHSARDACKLFAANEFGLGVFEVGSLLLTHPERLQSEDDLWMLCAGDICELDAKHVAEKFPFALAYRFEHDALNFGGFFFSVSNISYGVPTAFVP